MLTRVPFGSSLRVRVMIGVVVPLIIILGAAAQIQYIRNRELLLENLQELSVSIGDGIEVSLTRAMLARNHAELAQVARDLVASGSIRNLMILDKQGIARIASRAADLNTQFLVADATCQICHQAGPADSSRSAVLSAADGTRVFRNVTPIRNRAACQACHGATARLNGILVIDLPYAAVEEHLWLELRQSIFFALATIAFVAIVINLLLNRIVIAKLESFRASLTHYARGNFSARVPVTGNDELGALARAVNTMAVGLGEKAELEQKVQRGAQELERESARLRALYRVALESSRSLHLDQVMRAGLESALTVMGMEAGEIHLRENATGLLRLRACVGTPPTFAAAEDAIGCGECICGSVVARGQICALADLAPDERVTRLACRRHGFRAVAAVPLKARGQAFGVLTLHSRAAREFSPDDLALLNALGDQLGIAIDNAQLYTEMEARVQELSRQVQHLAILEERDRLAREMHDGFAQTLSVLHLKLQMAQSVRDGDGQLADTLAEMHGIVDEAYEDVRQAIGDLRLTLARDDGIVAALSEYAQNFALRYDLQAEVIAPAEAVDARCAPAVEIQVVRIVQEALANVRKHARARQVTLRLARVDGNLKIEIRDDGQGFEPNVVDPVGVVIGTSGHFGLAIMHERAASFNGALEIHSRRNAGTTIVLTAPLLRAGEGDDGKNAYPIGG